MKIIYVFALVFYAMAVAAQDYPYDLPFYNFVDYSKAKIVFSSDSSSFEKIHVKLDSMIRFGKSSLHIVQVGASHTQADIFSNQVRMRLQTFHPGLIGARGFVFPYRMTKTNNPTNYSVKYSGTWTTCRNVEYRKTCDLGISGVSATTTDPNASLAISMNPANPIAYDFNEVKIFTAPYINMYDIVPAGEMGAYTVTRNDTLGCIDFKFERYQSVASFRLMKNREDQKSFTLYGFSLENDNPGITYSAIGINGASLISWLRCQHFARQVQMLQPDWFLFLLGTNDGYVQNFNPERFYSGYVELVSRVKQYCPDAVITFVVPNDCYLFRKRPNPATEEQEKQVLRLVEKYHESMFSVYDCMGGFGSSKVWMEHGLMAGDRVHMSVAGYKLCADMFFNGFLRTFDNYLDKKRSNN
jgi:lysophospholipase L1-like esterase